MAYCSASLVLNIGIRLIDNQNNQTIAVLYTFGGNFTIFD